MNYVKKITTKITTAPGLHNFTQLLQKEKEEKKILSTAKKLNATFISHKKTHKIVPYSLDCFVFVLSRHFSKVFGTYGSTVIISAKHAISHLAEIEPLQESKKIHNGIRLFLNVIFSKRYHGARQVLKLLYIKTCNFEVYPLGFERMHHF